MTGLPLYPRAEFPRELDICLTDGCNLDCGYCYFDAKRRSSPVALTPAQIERALDLYLGRIRPERIQKLSFSGGEPLTVFPTLLAGLAAARRKVGPRANIEVFTNGTLLDRRKAELLMEHDPALIISLDGPREVCDAGRKFWRGAGRSVYGAVSRNLKALGPDLVSRCFAGATFSRGTVGRMKESVEFLLEQGFKCVIVDLDVLARWDERSVAALRRQAEELKRLYAANLECGFGEVQQRLRFDFLISREELARVARPAGLRELSLAPDGRFYPSGLVSGYGPAKARYLVGDLERGFDDGRMNAVLGELRRYFAAHPRGGYNGCPTHVYFDCRLGGLDPERVFDAGERLFRALDPLIGPVIDFELLQNALASAPGLGDFDHLPPAVPGRELRELALELPDAAGRAAGHARAGIDALLYSPGGRKRLTLAVAGGPGSFEALSRLGAYALMKARRLGKALRLAVRPRSAAPCARTLEFIREHGLELLLSAGGRSA